MKKSRCALLIAAAVTVLAGCGGGRTESGAWGANENSIYVSRALEIRSAMVYTSEKENDTYNQDELQAFAQDAVDAYNTANQAAADAPLVSLASCKLEGSTGTLVFDYASGDDFVKFAQEAGDDTHTVTAFSAQKVSDALAAGGITDGTFLNTEGKPVSAEEAAKQQDYNVVAVEGSATICTEGPVVYRSEGVELRDSYTASVPEGKSYIIFK